MKYRKKPLIVEAIEWTGSNPQQILDFCPLAKFGVSFGLNYNPVLIFTKPEGTIKGDIGDILIREPRGEYNLVKPDIFDMFHEEVDSVVEIDFEIVKYACRCCGSKDNNMLEFHLFMDGFDNPETSVLICAQCASRKILQIIEDMDIVNMDLD